MILVVVLGVVFFFASILTALIGGNWLWTRVRKPKAPSKESIRRYRERLLKPCWGDLQRHFGMTIPEPLKELYRRTELLIEHDVVFRDQTNREWRIAEFAPADLKALDETWPDLKEGNHFTFAHDSLGDSYYVDLTRKGSKGMPVMLYHHDGSDVEIVATSLDEFLGWYRAT